VWNNFTETGAAAGLSPLQQEISKQQHQRFNSSCAVFVVFETAKHRCAVLSKQQQLFINSSADWNRSSLNSTWLLFFASNYNSSVQNYNSLWDCFWFETTELQGSLGVVFAGLFGQVHSQQQFFF
ncbi:hypothetical protein Ccrd_013074, partial [Cynara cardunculus var. scolymus]